MFLKIKKDCRFGYIPFTIVIMEQQKSLFLDQSIAPRISIIFECDYLHIDLH